MAGQMGQKERDPIAERLAKVRNRPVHVFEVPATMKNGITAIGIAELTLEDELQAAKRSRGEMTRLAFELAKASLVEIKDGAGRSIPISLADGSCEKMWDEMGPKLRQLTLAAYSDVHTPEDGAVSVFLASRTVRVG